MKVIGPHEAIDPTKWDAITSNQKEVSHRSGSQE